MHGVLAQLHGILTRARSRVVLCGFFLGRSATTASRRSKETAKAEGRRTKVERPAKSWLRRLLHRVLRKAGHTAHAHTSDKLACITLGFRPFLFNFILQRIGFYDLRRVVCFLQKATTYSLSIVWGANQTTMI